MSGRAKSPAVAGRVYRLLQRLLPRWFRTVHGAAMAAAFDECVADARRVGWWAVVRLLIHEAVDLSVTSARLRMDGGGRAEFGTTRERAGMANVRLDVRQALRQWRRQPGFVAVVLATMAIGVGASTAIWTVADGVLLRPLPHAEPDALVMVFGTSEEFRGARLPMSAPNYADLRADASAGFTDLAAYSWPRSATVLIDAEPDALRAVPVAGQLFGLLGNEAKLGRTLLEADDAPGTVDVVVLSEGLWRTRFGADPDVIGRTLVMDGAPHEIVGVMPARFAFPWADVDAWVPLRLDPATADRDTNYLQVIGRLAPGLTIEAAQTRAAVVMARLVEAYPNDNVGKGVSLAPRRDIVIRDAAPMMWILLGASGLLLLLSCANLANLLLARGAVRERELAVRSALGAGRRRIVRQLATETALLAAVGGVLAVLLARGLVDGLLALAPATLPRRTDIVLDGRTLLFAVAATLVSALLFGLGPALRSASADPGQALREGARGTGAGGRHRALRSLVVVQLALALVLVAAGGLLVTSFSRLVSVHPGFDPAGVLTFRVSPPEGRYPGPDAIHSFYDALLAEVAAIPGVTNVGATWALPFSPAYASGRVTIEGDPRPRGQELSAGIVPVRGDYFGTMRTRILAGRGFTDADAAGAPPVVLINEAAAARFWPGQDPVGKRLRRGRADETELPWITVIGVVEDGRRSGLANETEPEMYWTHAQSGAWARDLYVVLRGPDPNALARPVRTAVARVDPGLAVTDASSLEERIATSVATPRFRTTLLAAFAALALLLAVVGTWGVMAFVVAQRRHEIGVRMALGADAGRVLRSVLGDGLRLVGIAVVLGLVGAAFASRTISRLLFGVQPLDPGVHAAAIAILFAAALLACWLPARRASRLDPVSTLRD